MQKNDLVDHVHDAVGYNYRMNNLSAAVGCAQIENIKKIMKLKKIILIGITKFLRILNTLMLLKNLNIRCNYWLITGVLKNKELKNKLQGL